MSASRGRRPVAALALGLLLLACAGCGHATAAPPVATDAAAATVVLATVRTGAPTPMWNEVLADRFAVDLSRGATWTVVAVDGRPSTGMPTRLVAQGGNPLVRERAVSALQGELLRRLAASVADDPEVDLLAGFDLGSRLLADRPGPRTILVLDPGLSTAGALRFQDRGGALLGADPAAVAQRLAELGALPDLRGVDVVWAGLGDVVAPQEPLPVPTRAALVTLWRTVLERAGARVTVVAAPATGGVSPGRPPVGVVPVAAPVPVTGPVALGDAVLGFLPDQAVLREPARAALVLAPWVERLRAGGVRVVVTGTTSSAGDEAGRRLLSVQRAEAVAALLRDAGVADGLIEVRGVGDRFPAFVPDRDAAGRLDPVLAAANRTVVLELAPIP